jgi:rare lipoprotein A
MKNKILSIALMLILNSIPERIQADIQHGSKGIASWYGSKFHGKKTASGKRFNMYVLTAAHRTLPLLSYARVTNLVNNRSIVVQITDRGPYIKNRIIDLSYTAARTLGIKGLAKVKVIAI